VSEDGRLAGLDVGEGRIAVNRARPNEFTIDNWQRAMRANEIVRPEGKQERTVRPTVLPPPEPVEEIRGEDASRQVRGSADADRASDSEAGFQDADAAAAPHPYPLPVKDGERGASASAPTFVSGAGPSSGGFTCSEGLCLARHPSGAIVAHALDAEAALDACVTASVIVIDDATARNVCRWKDVLVVTKRDLALNGSAAITFLDGTGGVSGESTSEIPRVAAAIEYAISRPFRPWHEQRRFSREARGLPAYQRKQKESADPNAGSAE
jgi:competence protein ComEC